MAGSPLWKVYNSNGEYIAACKYVEDAAALVAICGEGATVRHDHKKPVWTEGSEAFSAGESYDRAGDLMSERLNMRATVYRAAVSRVRA